MWLGELILKIKEGTTYDYGLLVFREQDWSLIPEVEG